VLFQWDLTDTNFDNFAVANLGVGNARQNADLSASVHQMITPWDEGSDFGTTIPVAGVDYVRQPLAAVGFNDDSANQSHVFDLTGISALADAWKNNTNLNRGVILVPRPQLNANYPSTPVREARLSHRNRQSGVHPVLDTQIITSTNALTFSPIHLEAIEDASIQANDPATGGTDEGDLTARSFATLPVGALASGATSMALVKFGLGELLVNDPTGGRVITDADFVPFEAVNAFRPSVTFNVHKMLVNWDEATVTWNQFGTNGPMAGTHYDAAVLGTATLGGGVNSQSMDISTLANQWMQDPEENFGVICVPTGATDFVEVTSSEAAMGFLGGNDTRLSVLGTETVLIPTSTVVTVTDTISMTVESVDGTEYGLQSTSNLPAGTWDDTGATVTGNGNVLTVYDVAEPDANKGYRLIVK